MCQKEKCYWEVNLRKRFKVLSLIVVGGLIAFVVGMGIFKNETVAVLLCRLAFIIPMIQWLVKIIRQLSEDIDRLKQLDDKIYSPEPKNMEKLQEIQNSLYNHRKECYTIPNKFYDLYKNNDEDVAHRTARIDKRE